MKLLQPYRQRQRFRCGSMLIGQVDDSILQIPPGSGSFGGRQLWKRLPVPDTIARARDERFRPDRLNASDIDRFRFAKPFRINRDDHLRDADERRLLILQIQRDVRERELTRPVEADGLKIQQPAIKLRCERLADFLFQQPFLVLQEPVPGRLLLR